MHLLYMLAIVLIWHGGDTVRPRRSPAICTLEDLGLWGLGFDP